MQKEIILGYDAYVFLSQVAKFEIISISIEGSTYHYFTGPDKVLDLTSPQPIDSKSPQISGMTSWKLGIHYIWLGFRVRVRNRVQG